MVESTLESFVHLWLLGCGAATAVCARQAAPTGKRTQSRRES